MKMNMEDSCKGVFSFYRGTYKIELVWRRAHRCPTPINDQ